jgi:Coenzyme PQQ synthesis protein D (PqqD)
MAPVTLSPSSRNPRLLAARPRVPSHVVMRAFVHETVVLNLSTGRYHGLNITAGRMLEVVADCGTVGEAAARVAAEYGQSLQDVERDLCDLCVHLTERGLLEIDAPPGP